MQVAGPILYSGIFSAGIAFTLQIIGQKHAKPSHASVIMSMEAVFAALAGWIILNEQMVLKEYIGCALMLGGMLITQIPSRKVLRQSYDTKETDRPLNL
jgi:drug/metabolite transporter (DMT)-like permease